MSFVAQQTGLAKRNTRSVKFFRGSNYGTGRTDQRNDQAYVADFDFYKERAKKRAGSRKNTIYGYEDANVQHLMGVNVCNRGMAGVVVGGILTLYLADDMTSGLERYYTWQEVKDGFTWDELKNKTWNDLIRNG